MDSMSIQTVALLLQAAALVFYAGRLTQTVREHERRIERLETKFDRTEEATR